MLFISQWKIGNEIRYNTFLQSLWKEVMGTMLGTDIRGIMAEEEEVQRRQQALKSLVTMRSRQLRESLDERIKRARSSGDWTQLSKAECADLHKQEKAHLKSQL